MRLKVKFICSLAFLYLNMFLENQTKPNQTKGAEKKNTKNAFIQFCNRDTMVDFEIICTINNCSATPTPHANQ